MAVGRRSIERALLKVLGSGKGIPYSNSNTAINDNPRRFETTPLVLRSAVILVRDNNQLFGNAAAQITEIAAAGDFAFEYLDLSLFYFRNATAGLNGTIQILGTRC